MRKHVTGWEAAPLEWVVREGLSEEGTIEPGPVRQEGNSL